MELNDRTGVEIFNNQGLKMKILYYRNAKDIDIIFEDGYILYHKNYCNFKNRIVTNPNFKSLYGIGCIGDGKYKTKENGNITKIYDRWSSMLNRCYGTSSKQRCYNNCSVSPEWHNFQTFGKWVDENYYEIENERMHLDKDILVKGNKIYSPETCCFVPQKINVLFIKRIKYKSKYPIGVIFHKKNNRFVSTLSKFNEHIYLGSFNTPEETFQAYKQAKETCIKQVADEYKDKIPQKLYDAMYAYKVEITD